MVEPTVLLVMGLSRQQLTAAAGVAGGLAVALTTAALLAFSVLPAYSERWTDRLGSAEPGRGGPDPAEIVPGRDGPIAEPSPRGTADVDGALGAPDAADADDLPSAIEADTAAGDAPVDTEEPAVDVEDTPVADGGDAA